MIFDTDDFHEGNHGLDLLRSLKAANPKFKLTAFAVPAHCSDEWLATLPDWIEVAMHGWHHGGADCARADEAKDWSYEQALDALHSKPERFVCGFKAPGWQISDGTYEALLDEGWWVADQHYNDHRRPVALPFHCEGDGDHVHTHVQNVCGNGLAEIYPFLWSAVWQASEFQFVSEVVRSHVPVTL